MPTQEELAQRAKRTAWWLFAVRTVSGKTQIDAARELGLKASSSVSDMENGTSSPSLKQLVTLAAFYEVPLSLFTDPPMTDQERIESLANGAAWLEREDWEQGRVPDQDADDAQADGRRRAS